MSDVLEKSIKQTISELEHFISAMNEKIEAANMQLKQFKDILGDVEKLAKSNQKKSRLSDKAARLKNRLMDLGASDDWVKYSYNEVSNLLNINPANVTMVLDELKASGLRVVRLKSGQNRGNHFTYSGLDAPLVIPIEKDDTPPDPVPHNNTAGKQVLKREAGEDVALKNKVVDLLRRQVSRIKMKSFSMNLKNLSRLLEAKSADIHAALHALQADGFLEITRFTQSTWEYVFLIHDEVEK